MQKSYAALNLTARLGVLDNRVYNSAGSRSRVSNLGSDVSGNWADSARRAFSKSSQECDTVELLMGYLMAGRGKTGTDEGLILRRQAGR